MFFDARPRVAMGVGSDFLRFVFLVHVFWNFLNLIRGSSVYSRDFTRDTVLGGYHGNEHESA